MEKKKITAREVVHELRNGTSDKALMEKYSLSAQGLQSLFGKLVTAGVITQDELDERVPMSERTVDLGLFVCPACGNIQSKEFVKCPRCAFTVPGKAGDTSKPPKSKIPGKREFAVVPKLRVSDEADAEGSPIGPSLPLSRMVSYCKILSVGALVAYSVATIGLLFLVLRCPNSTALDSLVGVTTLGIPALAIAVIVFVALRVLTEAMNVFSTVSGSIPRNPPSPD
jgi:hypothetical protein